MTERGTTQTEVKVPKCWPNVKLTAPKIDGAKPAIDTSEHRNVLVGWRPSWAEAGL